MNNLLVLKGLSKFFLVVSILTSFITYLIENNFTALNGLTISEVFGSLGLFCFFVANYKSLLQCFKTSNIVYKYSFLLIIAFSINLFCIDNISRSLSEILKFIYLISLSFALYNTFLNSVLLLIKTIIVAFFLMMLFGFYDYVAFKIGFMTIFPNATDKYFISGFRVFGQVGDYTYCFLSLLVPYQLSSYSLKISKEWRLFLRVNIFLGMIFLVGTLRVSAIISMLLGVVIWLVYNKDFSVFKKYMPEFCLYVFALIFIKFEFAPLYELLCHRVEARIFNRVGNSHESGFITANFEYALSCFQLNPIFGNGFGFLKVPVYNVEIHGTYLKLLAETGLVGLVSYMFFLRGVFF